MITMFKPCRVPLRWIPNDTKCQLLETTSQLGLARVVATVQRSEGQENPRFELFAESFRGLSDGRGSVRMAGRAHADDEEFDEA
jgi:hypothetical protein